MGEGARTMVDLRIICVAAFGAWVVAPISSRAEACGPSELRGRVKSVIVTEALVDPMTGKIGQALQRVRIEVSQDAAIVETTLYAPEQSVEPSSKLTAYFENGRPTRELQTANGKTVATTTCSYDAEGRVVEARTQSENAERSMVETYEYGSGFIRHRASMFGRWKVINQTLDASGRVVKEVVLDEATSTVEQTNEFTYRGGRKEQCSVFSRDSRRRCSTTVVDSHGNETEMLAEGQSRKTSLEYDSIGNWVSKRISITGPRENARVEMIVRRKIEYW